MIKQSGVNRSMILSNQTGKEPMLSNKPGSSFRTLGSFGFMGSVMVHLKMDWSDLNTTLFPVFFK